MIEQFMILMIRELGPTGLLICGLYCLLGKHLKNISQHIETINHNTTDMKNALIAIMERLIKK